MKILIWIFGLLLLLVLALLLIRFAGKKPVKKRRVVIAVILFIPLVLGMTCSVLCIRNAADSRLQEITGEWECAEALLEDAESYTGYLNLEMEDDGWFSLYDGEAGNPGIAGWVTRIGTDQLLLICTNYTECDPPPGWWEMKPVEKIMFRLEEGTLFLQYEAQEETATLTFSKDTGS